MACFIVPGTEAIITTIATKVIEKKEQKNDQLNAEAHVELTEVKERWSHKLKRLNGLLWGGSALLAFEHLWHGEVQPFAPFLTAASTKAGTYEMLHEMSTVGVSMAVLVTAAWGVMTYVTSKVQSKAKEQELSKVEES